MIKSYFKQDLVTREVTEHNFTQNNVNDLFSSTGFRAYLTDSGITLGGALRLVNLWNLNSSNKFWLVEFIG